MSKSSVYTETAAISLIPPALSSATQDIRIKTLRIIHGKLILIYVCTLNTISRISSSERSIPER